MKYITGFTLFKVDKKEKETQPDYKVSINVGTQEQPEYIECAGAWVKEGKNNRKFLSAVFSKAFGDRKAYAIVEVPSEDSVIPKFERDSKGNEIKGQEEETLDF